MTDLRNVKAAMKARMNGQPAPVAMDPVDVALGCIALADVLKNAKASGRIPTDEELIDELLSRADEFRLIKRIMSQHWSVNHG